MNRDDLSTGVRHAANLIVNEKGFIAPIDIFMALDYLKDNDIKDWRMKRVPYLERKIACNLGKTNHILRELARYAKAIGLKPSMTIYSSWGKGDKQPLRFSKFRDPNLEKAYSTHYVKKPVRPEKEVK
jgi:hypothetical protein